VIEAKLKEARLRIGKHRMLLGTSLFASLCLCGLLVFGLSYYDFSPKKNNIPAVAVPKERLVESDKGIIRGQVIEKLQEYENKLEPRFEAVNVELWNQNAFIEAHELKKKVMSNFTGGEYRIALDNLQSLENLTRETLKEADNIFKENLEKADLLLTEDIYKEAKFHIQKALLVDPQSPEALELQQPGYCFF